MQLPLTIPGMLSANADESGSLIFHLKDEVRRLGSEELLERIQPAASWLTSRGVGRGARVGILGPNRPEWVIWAYAAWWVGAAVVPVQVPLRVSDPQALQERLGWITKAAGCDVVMCDPDLVGLAPPEIGYSWTVLPSRSGHVETTTRADDTAVIQFTSGSTSTPKGVVLTHAAMVAQIDQVAGDGPEHGVHSGDVGVGWAPFFHDLGLMTCVLMPVLGRNTMHVLPTELFARDPSAWLTLLESTRAVVTVAPHSAFMSAFRAASRRGLQLDLSSLDRACFAAEGVDVQAVTELLDYCVAAGLPAQALASSYGLAESVAGVATSLRGDGLHLDELRDSSGASHQFVSSGPTLRDMSVRIVADGRSVGDGEIGEIEVAGPCLMSGYLDPAIDSPIRHGWLNTGDLGYLRDGEVYVTGRIKDMVIVMGHNYYPDDLEWAASRVPGIRPGRCVAFSDGERAVLLVEAREDAAGLATQVRHAVADAVGLGRVEVNVVPRDTVEKTTSGKLRRSTMKELYRTGGLTIESTSG